MALSYFGALRPILVPALTPEAAARLVLRRFDGAAL